MKKAHQNIQSAVDSQNTKLDLSGLDLVILPGEIYRLTKLRDLNLSNNKFATLPAEIGNFVNLRTLDLSGNRLKSLPPEIGQLSQLMTLNLRVNRLKSLNPQIRSLTRLKRLFLSANQFKVLPIEVTDLNSLEILDLDANQLENLPSELRKMKRLKSLDLGNNRIEIWPQEIRHLADISQIDLNDNQLNCLPKEIAELTQLMVLDLGRNRLKVLPPELGGLRSLSVLDLNGNMLKSIPAEISKLTALTHLNLGNNQLTRLPPETRYLNSLTSLNLYGNHLRSLPAKLEELSQLSRLNLGKNHLATLPTKLENLPKLKEVFIHDNQLTYLPSRIGKLNQLTKIALNSNKLKTLPVEIGKLSLLTDLNIRDNFLVELPQDIGLLENLKKLEAKGNPLESPPIEIIDQGLAAIRAYFKTIKSEEAKPLKEVKVLLIGDGGSGKTSLMKQLLGQKFDLKEDQTHGINIRDFAMGPKGEALRVRLWDFGGQEIMHATHQFFLSHRSLYLVVLDGRREEKPEYWLKYARSFGGNSPIFVVLNKMDQHKGYDVDRETLKTRYPAIRDFFPLSCAKGTGLPRLKREMVRTLATLEMATTSWPLSWYRVKQRLEEGESDHLSKTEFLAMCKKEGVQDSEDQNVLVRFLNDLGVAIHFDEFHLQHTFVLRPRWATSAVYRIINSSSLAKGKGVLKLSAFREILERKGRHDPFQYLPEVIPFLLDLMEKFEICYKLDDKQRILVPDLLPTREPPHGMDLAKAHKFRISYDLLPRTVISRLIVRRHKEIDGENRWRGGVVFYNPKLDSKALLRADYENNTLLGWITGGAVHQYLIALLDAIDDINQGFIRNTIVEEVACICDKCFDQIEPEFHPVFKLLQHFLKGLRHYPCNRSVEVFSIAEILGHALTGEANDLERILDEISQMKHELMRMQPNELKKTLSRMATSTGVSGVNIAWLIEKLMTHL